jgi:hypothetical protein
MRKSFSRTGTGVTALVGACALTGTVWAGSAGAAGRAPVSGQAVAGQPAVGQSMAALGRGGQVCRRAEVRPASGLTAQALVCLRFENGSWVGSGQLVLKATKMVSGAFSWGPSYYPVRPSVLSGGGTFDLRAGQTATYALRGVAEADPADTGADWWVWIGVPNGIRATGFDAEVTSPVASRQPSPDQASRFKGSTRWTCTARPVSGQTVVGVATLCVRQVRGTLESRASLTYTSTDTADLNLGLAVDGVIGATSNTVPIAASPGARHTVTLPASTAQARRQDHRVATFLRLGETPVLSKAVAVR